MEMEKIMQSLAVDGVTQNCVKAIDRDESYHGDKI